MRIHRHRNRKQKYEIPAFKANEKITSEEVRLIDHENEMRGVVPTSEALAIAKEAGLDLIEVSPKANPPVCKILDYGSFKYQKEKEAKKQRAAAKQVETKGVRLTLRIGENDLNIRLNQAKKFLEKGSKVRIEMILRGREKAYAERGREIILNFVDMLKPDYDVKMEQPVKAMNGKMNTIVARTK